MSNKFSQVLDEASKVLLGKEGELKLALTCLLSNGHLLLEDIPGVGKTTLVYTLSKLLGLKLSRIQFTNDLLPTDILGTSIFDESTKSFEFKRGPIFGEMILADELNRATPKTQSALLQAMEERRINVDGNEFELENPFLIIATQNPFQQIGTFQLPESQIDRFFMSLSLGYPTREFEKEIILGEESWNKLEKCIEVLSKKEFIDAMKNIKERVHASEAIANYILDILEKGRLSLSEGYLLSPRAGKDLVNAAKTFAYLDGRDFVAPEDVQAVAAPVLGHRVGGNKGVQFGFKKIGELLNTINVS